MPISEEHSGRSYPATARYQVSRAKIAEFAAALGDLNNPAYQGPEPVAPPTFVAVLAAAAWEPLFADPELGLSLERTVHASQQFAWRRPLRAGDDISAKLRIEKVRVRGAAAVITIQVSLEDRDGELVATATSTLMHTAAEAA